MAQRQIPISPIQPNKPNFDTHKSATERKDFDQATLNRRLLEAAAGDTPDKVEYLLDNGADVNASDSNGWTALHYAVRRKYIPLCMVLLDHNANITAKDNDGFTPLYLAKYNKEFLLLILHMISAVVGKDNTDEFFSKTKECFGGGA